MVTCGSKEPPPQLTRSAVRGTSPKGEEVFGEVVGKAGIKGRNGIVFFQNYWGPGHQGDHIDLWNGSRLTDRMSWARIHIRFGGLGLGSDYRQAHAAWFWPLA